MGESGKSKDPLLRYRRSTPKIFVNVRYSLSNMTKQNSFLFHQKVEHTIVNFTTFFNFFERLFKKCPACVKYSFGNVIARCHFHIFPSYIIESSFFLFRIIGFLEIMHRRSSFAQRPCQIVFIMPPPTQKGHLFIPPSSNNLAFDRKFFFQTRRFQELQIAIFTNLTPRQP